MRPEGAGMQPRIEEEISERWLSRQLRLFGIRPRTVWLLGESVKGYLMADF
jgi:hypothetical protein